MAKWWLAGALVGCVLVFSSTGCVSARRTSQDPVLQTLKRYTEPSRDQLPAPDPALEPQPWRIGQWTLYKRRFGRVVVLETFKVVAQDACGLWIESEVHSGHLTWGWTYCVSAQPARDDGNLEKVIGALIVRDNGTVVNVLDFRTGTSDRKPFAWLIESIHAPWAGRAELAREDVITPAGHFAGTVKIESKRNAAGVSQWSHPEVPLGGLIRETTTDDHERVLLDYGSSNQESSVVSDALQMTRVQARAQRRGSMWLSYSLRVDSLGKLGEVNESTGFSFASGVRRRGNVDVVAIVDLIGNAPFSVDQRLEEIMFLAGLGARWMPFGRPRRPDRPFAFSATSLWVHADAGYAELFRGMPGVERSTVVVLTQQDPAIDIGFMTPFASSY